MDRDAQGLNPKILSSHFVLLYATTWVYLEGSMLNKPVMER